MAIRLRSRPFLAIVGKRPFALTLGNFAKEMEGLRISLLALFGWFNIPVSDWVYLVWDPFLLVCGIGLAAGPVATATRPSGPQPISSLSTCRCSCS